ncbi:uncharacterized protein LOC110039117, partial [Phalaenopsis equestris]|uniref:uncharacterized protein LOC110039117 n=1 Tax=Phalaenopsis equestris TaxID=78828 RepID=UPI0009E2BBF5
MVAWFIWMYRNHGKFGEKVSGSKSVIINCISYIQKFIKCHHFPNVIKHWTPGNNTPILQPFKQILWSPPPTGWLKVNTDGSFSNDFAGIGGIFRNSYGSPIIYFTTPVVAMDALEAEFVAIYWAIKIASYFNMGPLIIETHSTNCIKIHLRVETPPWNITRWNNLFLALLPREKININYIPRE